MSEFKDKNLTNKEEIMEVMRKLQEIDQSQTSLYMPADEEDILDTDSLDVSSENEDAGVVEFSPDEVVEIQPENTLGTDIVDVQQAQEVPMQAPFGGDDDDELSMHLDIGPAGMNGGEQQPMLSMGEQPLCNDPVADEDMPIEGVPQDAIMMDDVDEDFEDDLPEDLQLEDRKSRFDWGQPETEKGTYQLQPNLANYTNEPDRVGNRYVQAKAGDNPLTSHMHETIVESLELHLEGIATGEFKSAMTKVMNKEFNKLTENETASLAGTFINLLGETNSSKFEIVREAYHGEIKNIELIENISNIFNEYNIFVSHVDEGRKAKLGTGTRFKEVEAAAKKSGAKNPAAVAAAAGNKKYGKNKMKALAKKGRNESIEETQVNEMERSAEEEDWIKAAKPNFKEQYGENWKKVLYATANKKFRSESVEESSLNEKSKKDDNCTVTTRGKFVGVKKKGKVKFVGRDKANFLGKCDD